jgi:AcrR family transcriptional regulator
MAKKKPRVSMRDLERESRKFHAPATDKEKAIIEAAVTLIGERGIDGATTAAIAKRANVTEKTLFRYFPSKADLVRRVLFPLILQRGLSRQWEQIETLLKTKGTSLKDWYIAATTKELHAISRNVGLTRTVNIELLQNAELREALAQLWQQHIWKPMLETLGELQRSGVIRKDVDIEVLARAMHCLHVGYFLARHVFAPDADWDDAREVEQMAEILTAGSGTEARPAQANLADAAT